MRPLLRRLLLLVALVLVVVAATVFRPARHADWIADYEQLRSTVATSYANLGYARSRGVALDRLDAETRRALDEARTDLGARRTIGAFVAAFHDPHFRVVSEPPRLVRAVTERLQRDASPVGGDASAACRALGYGGGIGDGYSLPFDALPGYRASAAGGGPYHPGVVRLGERTVGVLRIASFDHRRALPECEAAWRERAAGEPATCDDACAERLRARVKVRAALRLRETVAGLAREGAELVVVDIGGNGGGTEWVGQAAAALAAAPLVMPRTLLAGSESAAPCPWDDAARGRCDNLVPVAADSAADVPPAPVPVPIVVLTDRGTASASEYFAAVLRDNGAVRLAGATTFGAGCGYRGGRGEVVLARSGLRVRIPNCARLRRDGRNEREGIAPDVVLDDAGAPEVRAERALRRILAG